MIFTAFSVGFIKGQNLIRNGNFEEFDEFENFDFGYKYLENNVTTWRNPTLAKPKIYSDEKTAKSGKSFAGIHCYGIKNYREYISTPLNCRLIKGETYILRMYVKLSDNSEFAMSSFGAALTKTRPDMKTSGPLTDSTQVFVDNKNFFFDTRAWVVVEDSFVAEGDEAFLTIGNFLTDEESVSKKVVRMAREGRAYYYIDDVRLFSKNGHDPCKAIIDSFNCENVKLSSTNILPDPSFECYTECPSNVNTSKLYQLKYWDQTSGTPDYYNACSIIMSVPENIMGQEEARNGHGYVGMYLFDQGNYREFLSAKLTKPMVKERWYVIKLYAALSENSGLATDNFEFLITEKYPMVKDYDSAMVIPASDSTEIYNSHITNEVDTNYLHAVKAKIKDVEEKEGKMLEDLRPQVINEPGNFGDQYTWKKICGMYLAEGGEMYITMGNFNDDKNTNKKIMNPKAGGFAYYFIDDFTVEPLNDSNMSDCGAGIPIIAEDETDFETPRYFQDLDLAELLNDEPFTFQGFYFEFDKYEILDTNYYFLDSLVDLLLENEDLSLEVQGHTDDVGSNSYNEKLSKNRAVAVVNYLISEGIDKKRIKYSYYGATRPVATNSTPEGRQLNRRCEFILKR
ncbi:OmpA family protein [bacterium]|nr:OmpA family protein [bacterium]